MDTIENVGNRHYIRAGAEGRLRVDQSVVKVTGQQYAVKFSHEGCSFLI